LLLNINTFGTKEEKKKGNKGKKERNVLQTIKEKLKKKKSKNKTKKKKREFDLMYSSFFTKPEELLCGDRRGKKANRHG